MGKELVQGSCVTLVRAVGRCFEKEGLVFGHPEGDGETFFAGFVGF